MKSIFLNDFEKRNIMLRRTLFVIFFILIITVLIIAAYSDYNIFHLFSEMLCFIIGMSIFIISINTYDIADKSLFCFIGISFIFIDFYKLLHLLTFTNTKVLNSNDAYMFSLKAAVAAIIMETVTYACISFINNKNIKCKYIISFYTAFSCIIFILMKILNTFDFSKIFWAIVIAIFIISAVYFFSLKNKFDLFVFCMLEGAIILMLLSIIFMVVSNKADDIFKAYAHVFNVLSFYFMFEAISENNLKLPYKTIFNKLTKTNEELKSKTLELENTNSQLKNDVIYRKKIEMALRESESRYRRVVELSPDAILLHKSGKIIYVNSAAANLIGVSNKNEIIGKDFVDYISPEYKIAARKEIDEAYTLNKPYHFIEGALITKANTKSYVEVAAAPFSQDGNVIMILVRDINEIKKAEQNKKLLDEAIEYDKLRTDFFANISHELRTPLNVIYGALQLLELYYKNQIIIDKNNVLTKNIKMMRQNCLRLLRLVTNLIDITKIDSGFYNISPKNMNIVSVVEDITMSVVQYAKSKAISLLFDTEIEEKIMAIDPDKIERIMLNLLSNSVKFTDPKGSIWVNVYDRKDKILICVKDNGTGIPEDKLSTIFDRFVQVDKSLNRNNEGSGIGLSLVKSLVEMHGGNITAKSKLNVGSEFTIELPVRLCDSEENVGNGIAESKSEVTDIEFSDIYS